MLEYDVVYPLLGYDLLALKDQHPRSPLNRGSYLFESLCATVRVEIPQLLTHSTIRPFVNASGLLGFDSLCALSHCQVLKCDTLTPVIKTPYVRLGIEYESILGGLSRTQTSQHLRVRKIGFPITLKPIFLVDLMTSYGQCP